MALNWIAGGSGSGKTEFLYKKIIEMSLAEPDARFFILVPEQATMQAQKEIVRLHPRHGTMNIDIVSFDRLAYRIFSELSIPQPEILDDMGKTMVLRKLAGEKKKELLLFSSHLNRPGFIAGVKSMLSELYQYGVSPEALKEQAKPGGSEPDLIRQAFGYGGFVPGVPGVYEGAVHYVGGAFGRAVPCGGPFQAFKGVRSCAGRIYRLYAGPVPGSWGFLWACAGSCM